MSITQLSRVSCFLLLTLCSWCPAQSYLYEASHVAISSTAQTATVEIFITDLSTPPAPTDGYAMAMTHDPSALRVVSVSSTEFGDPGFDSSQIYDNGWSNAVIYDHANGTRDFSVRQRVLQVTYEILGDPDVGTVVPLSWGVVGQPLTENKVALVGVELLPTLSDGSISIGSSFVRGDADNDSTIGISDVIVMQNYMFLGGAAASCATAMDVNADGSLGLPDIFTLLHFQFLGGSPPVAPFPECDLADIQHGCDAYDCP